MENNKDRDRKFFEEIEENNNCNRNIQITYNGEGMRLDIFLSLVLNDEYKISVTRSEVKKQIKKGDVSVNGKLEKPSYILKEGDVIEYNVVYDTKKEIHIDMLECVLNNIIFEDDDIILVDKPKGLIVHSGTNTDITLVDILKQKYILYGEEGREGIVHRLDKDTSGLMVIAKTKAAYDGLVSSFKKRKVIKKYYAVVEGILPEKEGIIDMPIRRSEKDRTKMVVSKDGKRALTKFNVLKYISNMYTLLDIEIFTGRTHQIRVHMSKIGYPVLGDYIYGKGKNDFGIEGQVLQSYCLEFLHPVTGKMMKFEIAKNSEIMEIIESDIS